MRIKPSLVVAGLAAFLPTGTCVAAFLAQSPEPVDWRSAKPLTVEAVGSPVGQAWARPLDQVKVPGKDEYVQLIWYKMGARSQQLSWLASLNLATGTLKAHPPIAGWEVWRTEWAGSKLFIGTQAPGHLAVYDPNTDSLTDLGKVFTKGHTAYSMSGAEDGSLAIGAAGSTEVALYDPRTGRVRQYGEVGRPAAGYIYYVSQDRGYIYAVARGACPWDLIAINKETGARSTLITKPSDGYINLYGSTAEVTDKFRDSSVPTQRLVLRDGKLLPPSAAVGRGHRSAPAPPFEVALDKRAAASTGKVMVMYRRNRGAAPAAASASWNSRPLTVGIESMPITRLISIGPSQLAGTTGPYGPMFVYDIARNNTRILGYPAAMNPFSIAKIGSSVYISGYPSTQFAAADLNRQFTTEEGAGEGQGIPWTDARANPHLISSLGTVLQGSHTGVGIFNGVDGRIYIVGQRHRFFKGFGVAWYDPRTGKLGEVEDGGILQQLQISWAAAIDGGRKIAMTTRVQPDENKSAAPPKEAQLFILDTASGRFARPQAPLPGAQALGPFAESGGSLIGIASDPAKDEAGPTTVYRFDLASGRTTASRTYAGLICGISSNNDAPHKSHDFITGPDGKIWSFYRVPYADAKDILMRIRPSDLGIELLGSMSGDGIRLQFVNNDVYFTGEKQLRRLRSAAR